LAIFNKTLINPGSVQWEVRSIELSDRYTNADIVLESGIQERP